MLRGEEYPLEKLEIGMVVGSKFLSTTVSAVIDTGDGDHSTLFAHTTLTDREQLTGTETTNGAGDEDTGNSGLPDMQHIITVALESFKDALMLEGGIITDSSDEEAGNDSDSSDGEHP